jgi:thiosulfate dehydrogenase (quinone) large subunit
MNTSQKSALFLLRVSLGFLFLYAGLSKVLDPKWTSAGYLKSAKLLPGFYGWLASPGMLPFVDFVNEWGLTFLGAALVLGLGVRLATWGGALLMALYYIPLGFPYPNAHALLVDEHIVYIAALATLGAFRAGEAWGLERWCADLPLCRRYPILHAIVR